MDIMNAQLDKISKTLRSGFSIVIPQLANVEKNLSSINDKIADINQHVAKIDKYSFLTMWGTI